MALGVIDLVIKPLSMSTSSSPASSVWPTFSTLVVGMGEFLPGEDDRWPSGASEKTSLSFSECSTPGISACEERNWGNMVPSS